MSDKPKMTPGPWRSDTKPARVLADESTLVAFCAGNTEDAEQIANARAIACMPELIEAARWMLAYCEANEDHEPCAEQAVSLRRILARIEGEDA